MSSATRPSRSRAVVRRWLPAGVAAVGAAVGAAPPAAAAPAHCTSPARPVTVAYERLPGVPANATSLDVYVPAGCRARSRRAPVVVWVHGGGYHRGDKAGNVADKRRLFNTRGWLFVSVNYRLTRPGSPVSARYPDHYRDVAAAVAWTRRAIGPFGGDPSRIALLGHSAGADIVSNVVTNPAWLGGQGLGLASVRCAGPFDTAGFDKTRVPAASREQRQWRAALGNDPAYAVDTSATLLARAGTGIPPTLTVVRGGVLRRSIETGFAARLMALGVPAGTIDASSLTHAEVSNRIGAPGDTVMTPPLVRFLRGCFAR